MYINGDTLVTMNLKTAQHILIDLEGCRYTDSILIQYKQRDTLYLEKIVLLEEQVMKMDGVIVLKDTLINNMGMIIDNKDKEIWLHHQDKVELKRKLKRSRIINKVMLVGVILLLI